MLSFSSSGFLLGFNKGGLAVWNQLTAVQDIGLEWALSLQRDEQWKVNYRHLQWSFWRSSESFDGMPCRKLTLSFPALLLWVSRDCQSLGLSCQQLLTPRVSAAPPIPTWIGQQISWEVNFLSQLCRQEKSVAHLEWRARANLVLREMIYHMCSTYNHQMCQGMNVMMILFSSGSFVAVLLGAELELFHGKQHLWPWGDCFVKYFKRKILKESKPLVCIHLWCFLFLLFQEFLGLCFLSPLSRFSITMVWKQTGRNTSVWSLSEPTNVCRELGGKHSRALISALKIVAPFSQGVK